MRVGAMASISNARRKNKLKGSRYRSASEEIIREVGARDHTDIYDIDIRENTK